MEPQIRKMAFREELKRRVGIDELIYQRKNRIKFFIPHKSFFHPNLLVQNMRFFCELVSTLDLSETKV